MCGDVPRSSASAQNLQKKEGYRRCCAPASVAELQHRIKKKRVVCEKRKTERTSVDAEHSKPQKAGRKSRASARPHPALLLRSCPFSWWGEAAQTVRLATAGKEAEAELAPKRTCARNATEAPTRGGLFFRLPCLLTMLACTPCPTPPSTHLCKPCTKR